MVKRKLKSFVIPSVAMLLIIVGTFITIISMKESGIKKEDLENVDFVSDTILNNDVPVISTSAKIINPYTDTSVTLGKSFYDYKGTKEQQEKSLIYHENTYLQNSGVDFISQNVFDVVAILPGTVADVSDNESLGKTIQIKHDNGYVSVYQSLSEVTVKKGYSINQGQTIGKSGSNELDKEIGNHLHLELYVNGQVVDPMLYLDKELSKPKEWYYYCSFFNKFVKRIIYYK